MFGTSGWIVPLQLKKEKEEKEENCIIIKRSYIVHKTFTFVGFGRGD